MPGLKSWAAQDSTDLLSSHRQKHAPAGALSAANALARGSFDQPLPPQSMDVRGQHLRQLRLQRDLDPVLLATQACISLRQLQQLETGEHSLFYSAGLRNQAGRRVAALLGAQWDELDSALMPLQGKHLQLVTAPVPDQPEEVPPKRQRPPAWVLAGVVLALLAVSGMAAHALRGDHPAGKKAGGQVNVPATPAAQAAAAQP